MFIKRILYRIFQKIVWIAAHFLNFREPEVIVEENASLGIPKLLKEKKYRGVLVITDAGLMNAGIVQPFLDELRNEEINFTLFDKTTPNPPFDDVLAAYQLYLDNNHEAIIAFGGGSPIDLAKAVGAKVTRPKKELEKMRGLLKIRRTIPDLYAIPTTAGTGSECTLAAVVTNPATHEKFAINDPVLIPRYAVLDPNLTVNLSAFLTATTGMDALTHAVEAYIGKGNTKKTRKNALEAIKLIADNLYVAYKNKTIESKRNMQIAAYKAGLAFTRAYVGNVHAMGHQLSGYYQLPHGYTMAVILPHMLRFYGKKAHKKLSELFDLLFPIEQNLTISDKANRFIEFIDDLKRKMDIPDKFTNVIKDSDIYEMAKRAYKEANPLYPVPKIMSFNDFNNVYHELDTELIK